MVEANFSNGAQKYKVSYSDLALKDLEKLKNNIEYIEAPWIVKSVKPQDDYTLLLQFDDGKRGVYDMWPRIQQEDGGNDTFVPLKDINYFMKAYQYLDTVFWPGDIAIAPEELYENCMTIQEYEEWCAEDDEDD